MAAGIADGYVDGLDGWQKETVASIRKTIKKVAPEASETIKWAQPVYESNGPFAYIKAFKNSANFGFWRGIDLEDPENLLQGTGDKMRHVTLTGPADINRGALQDFIRQAVALNERKGDPTEGG